MTIEPMENNTACPHKHTGSSSPNGVYLYVRCMDCGELLCLSDTGKHLLANCPGYEPKRTGYSRSCIHCGFDFHDHRAKIGWTTNRPEIVGFYWVHKDNNIRIVNVWKWKSNDRLFTNEDCGAPVDSDIYEGAYWYGPIVAPNFELETS